jgi:hypothetical protein
MNHVDAARADLRIHSGTEQARVGHNGEIAVQSPEGELQLP